MTGITPPGFAAKLLTLKGQAAGGAERLVIGLIIFAQLLKIDRKPGRADVDVLRGASLLVAALHGH